jgi:hypothetical protein
MSAVEVFSIIKDIALSGAACATAYVAFTGLEKWQKKLKVKQISMSHVNWQSPFIPFVIISVIAGHRLLQVQSSRKTIRVQIGTQPKRKDKPGRMYIQKDGSL